MKLTDENQDYEDARPLGRDTGHSAGFRAAFDKLQAEARAKSDKDSAAASSAQPGGGAMTDETKSDDLTWLPNVRIGADDRATLPIEDDPDPDPDDEPAAVTPPDVIEMLGFDPLDMDDEEPAEDAA